jgi:hypothetical protein
MIVWIIILLNSFTDRLILSVTSMNSLMGYIQGKKKKKRKTRSSTEWHFVWYLCRLPNISVIRIKCTRNVWYARLADPQFVDLHFSREMENLCVNSNPKTTFNTSDGYFCRCHWPMLMFYATAMIQVNFLHRKRMYWLCGFIF